VTYVRWMCQVTTRLSSSGSGCVTISHMILNRVIQRYRIIDYVVKSHFKYLMSFGNIKFVVDCFATCSTIV
jgi:hypothetical protein